MASASAKKLAVANTNILNQLLIISASINIIVFLIISIFHRPSSYKPWIIFSIPSILLQYSLEKFGRPKYTNGNSLVSSGEDIRLLGSLYEYYFDVIYLTWGFDILMIIFGSNKVWYGYLIIPGFAIYKLGNFILPFIKKNKSNGSTPDEQQAETKQTNSATSKRQQKLQARREKGPAVKYR